MNDECHESSDLPFSKWNSLGHILHNLIYSPYFLMTSSILHDSYPRIPCRFLPVGRSEVMATGPSPGPGSGRRGCWGKGMKGPKNSSSIGGEIWFIPTYLTADISRYLQDPREICDIPDVTRWSCFCSSKRDLNSHLQDLAGTTVWYLDSLAGEGAIKQVWPGDMWFTAPFAHGLQALAKWY